MRMECTACFSNSVFSEKCLSSRRCTEEEANRAIMTAFSLTALVFSLIVVVLLSNIIYTIMMICQRRKVSSLTNVGIQVANFTHFGINFYTGCL